jgi:hypothetical protein
MIGPNGMIFLSLHEIMQALLGREHDNEINGTESANERDDETDGRFLSD